MNCSFKGTDLTAVVLTSACLQGADSSGAQLSGAKMAGAAVAKAPGTLMIIGNPMLPPKLIYTRPTLVADSATDHATTCPNEDSGMCTGDMWTSSKAPMTTWAAPPAPKLTEE